MCQRTVFQTMPDILQMFLFKLQLFPGRLPTTSERIVLLNPALSEKVAAAESNWIFKLAESDLSHRSRDHLSETFQSVFSDNEIASQFSMAQQTTLYIIQDGIEISKMIFVAVCQSKTCIYSNV